MRLFLDDIEALEMRMKVAVNGVQLFFDVEGAKVRRTGPGCATARR